MSDILDIMKRRYSVRKFSNQPVEQAKIDLILEAGNVAPTACNNQPQIIYVVKSKEGLATLDKCKHQRFGETLAFIICYDETKCWVRKIDNHNSGEVDSSIVTTHMMLEAESLGIGSTWIMMFNPEAIKDEFKLDKNIIPVAVLVMGYPAIDAAPSDMHTTKKAINEIIIDK